MAIKQIRSVLRRFTLPLPVGLRHSGRESLMSRPRRVHGARFISIGSGTRILPGGELTCLQRYQTQSFSPSLHIGNGVYIGRDVCIVCVDSIDIQDGCVLSDHVYLADNSHGIDPNAGPIMQQSLLRKGPVTIGANSFIGYRAAIMPGVVLGRSCVVGANAVVTTSFPAYSMIAGVPAKLIKKFDLKSQVWIAIEKVEK